MTCKVPLSVAYLSPGWPLSHFPNGIVAYLENLIAGFDRNTQAYILANHVRGNTMAGHIVDLSAISLHRTLVESCLDKLASRTSLSCAHRYTAQRSLLNAVQKVNKGLDLLAIKPDIIEVEESLGLALSLVEKLSTPVVTRLHGPWFIHGPIMQLDNAADYRWRVKIEGEGILASQGVTAPSLDVLNKVREYYDLSLFEAKVIPNPVLPVPKEKQWQYNCGARAAILVVGRFDLHKGGDLVLNAFQIIASKNKDIELLFVGPDRGVVIDYVEYDFSSYVEKFMAENSIKRRVHFLGHCDTEKIAKLRRNTTITVIPSRYETFSISMVEALSAGSPVVAYAVGAIRELVTDGFNGLLAEPESAESLAENVLRLLDDPEKMNELSANAIEDSVKRFSPNVVAKQTVAYYKEILLR